MEEIRLFNIDFANEFVLSQENLYFPNVWRLSFYTNELPSDLPQLNEKFQLKTDKNSLLRLFNLYKLPSILTLTSSECKTMFDGAASYKISWWVAADTPNSKIAGLYEAGGDYNLHTQLGLNLQGVTVTREAYPTWVFLNKIKELETISGIKIKVDEYIKTVSFSGEE